MIPVSPSKQAGDGDGDGSLILIEIGIYGFVFHRGESSSSSEDFIPSTFDTLILKMSENEFRDDIQVNFQQIKNNIPKSVNAPPSCPFPLDCAPSISSYYFHPVSPLLHLLRLFRRRMDHLHHRRQVISEVTRLGFAFSPTPFIRTNRPRRRREGISKDLSDRFTVLILRTLPGS